MRLQGALSATKRTMNLAGAGARVYTPVSHFRLVLSNLK